MDERKPDQSSDVTRDWSGEEAEALRIEAERQADLIKKQQAKE